ncbi:hypothetical protein [Hoyosella subflava]|uniref:Heme peroxidase superfamily protein n=1 Tax=Hoyosella subflava (strain DSM 45089 / JCM 17490 / NBRC 109087 / DQS3-9A1) TaxID=443218 RepID=F6EP92_HOYSD|nr:hypothetical protein [Hoyosella subflava]AEF41752.1 hypothetical protein AS9A_3310 [Hoyosella subflava DQS3-9A1]
MDLSAHVLDRVAAGCRRYLGSPEVWPAAEWYRRSLGLCVIDAIQATAGHYPTALSVASRYCAYRSAQGVLEHDDGIRALLRTFEESGSAHAWAGKVATYKRRDSSPAQRVKARSIGKAADAFYGLRVDSTADLAALQRHPETRALLVRAWRSVVSHGFAANWDYLLTIAGVIPVESTWSMESCLPFMRTVLDLPSVTGDAEELGSVVHAVAQRLDVANVDLVVSIRRWNASHRVLLEPTLANTAFTELEDPIAVN